SAAVNVKIDRAPEGDIEVAAGKVAGWSLTVSTTLQGIQRVNVIVSNAADTSKQRGAKKPQSAMLTVAAGRPQHLSVVTWGERPAVRATIVKAKDTDAQKPQENEQAPNSNGGTASDGAAPSPNPPAPPAQSPPAQKAPAQKTPAQKPTPG